MFNSHSEVSECELGRALQFFNIHYFSEKSWSSRGEKKYRRTQFALTVSNKADDKY